MKAALLSSCPGQLQVVDDVEHDTVGPHEVLVRTAAAGVCHSDLHYIHGSYQTRTPTVPGHEAAGVVLEVGREVGYVKPGDHVVACLSAFCGTCEHCQAGRLVLCTKRGIRRGRGEPARLRRGGQDLTQFLDLSAFAERMLVHENALALVDPGMPLDRAALLGCAVTTGLGAVLRTAAVAGGTAVAVVGCGGVGLSIVQGAALAGAARIVAVDRSPARLRLAQAFGATDIVPAEVVRSESDREGARTVKDVAAQVRELTGDGVDHAFEAVGLAATAEAAFGMLRPAGTLTIVGMIPVRDRIELPGYEFLAQKRVQGCLMGSNNFRTDVTRYAQLYRQGRLNLDDLVSTRIPLEQVGDAFTAMAEGTDSGSTDTPRARAVVVFD